ncbi:MAG: hypothetical protein K2G67_06995 [Muribaculaceae bacterium]|nr:hypothetical protein [Muribaculaceae bacterium]
MKQLHYLFASVLCLSEALLPVQSSAESWKSSLNGESKLSERSLSLNKELATITVLPSPGIVTSLSEVKVAFIGISQVTVQIESEDDYPLLISSDGTEFQCSSIEAQGNTLFVRFNPEITDEDTYTLKVPRLCFKIDGKRMNSDLCYIYYISDNGHNGIIYSAPSGEIVRCQSDFLSYFILDGGLSGMPLAGKPLHYVIGDDGNLYLYNIITLQPYGGSQTSSYIVGTPSGNNKWKFNFPQPIYETISNGESQLWYVNYLCTKVDESTGQASYIVNESNNSVEFMIDENGNVDWIRATEDPNVDDGFAIGTTLANGIWTGFANVTRSTYQKFTDEAPEINPEEFEIWKLTYGPNGNRISRNVDVYFEGDDVWVRGFSKTYLPQAWAHGRINGSSITFDPYIGECDLIGQYLFIYGYSNSSGRSDLTFKYYAQEKGMTYNGEYIINPNQLFYYAVEAYEYPSLEYLCQGSGIKEITDDEVISTEWYSIDGIRIDHPQPGVNIARQTYSSGKTEFAKTINK